MLSGPLLSLPVELRLQIYDHVFDVPGWTAHRKSCSVARELPLCSHCGPCSILNTMTDPPRYPPARIRVDRNGVLCQPWSSAMRYQTSCFDQAAHIAEGWPAERGAILRTCRKISSEAKDVLYNDTLFLVHVRSTSTRNLVHRYPANLWTLPISIAQANYLRNIRHIDLSLSVFTNLDRMVPMLSDLLDVLPRLDQLKSVHACLECNLIKPARGTTTTPELWEQFKALLARLPFGNELRMCSWLSWLNERTADYVRLNEAIGRKLVLKRFATGCGFVPRSPLNRASITTKPC